MSPSVPPAPPDPTNTTHPTVRPVLDAIDHRLLELLTEDGRCALTALAHRLGVARSTVAVRLARLEHEGVISGYTVRRGPNHPQGAGMRAFVTIAAAPRQVGSVCAALGRRVEVHEVVTVAGDDGLLADVRTATSTDLDRLLTWVGTLDGVTRTRATVVLATRLRRSVDPG